MTKAGHELANRMDIFHRQILSVEIDDEDFQTIVYKIAQLMLILAVRRTIKNDPPKV